MNRKQVCGYFISTLLVLLACASKSSSFGKDDIKGLLLLWTIPVVNGVSGEVSNIKDSVLIYHLDDLVLYRVAYTYTKYNQNAQKGNMNIVGDDPKTIDFRETRFKNFIHRLGESSGFLYDSLDTNSHLTFNVDSFERKKTFKGSKFYDITNAKIVQSNFYKDKSILVEKYSSVTKPDESYSDTSYYYFNRGLNDILYSFSVEADTIKKMKLNKIRFIYNSVPKNGNSKIEIPMREVVLEIRSFPIKNNKEIASFFEKFKRDVLPRMK